MTNMSLFNDTASGLLNVQSRTSSISHEFHRMREQCQGRLQNLNQNKVAYLENEQFIGDGIVAPTQERQDTLIDLSFLGVSRSSQDERNNSCSFGLENEEAITSRPSRIDD